MESVSIDQAAQLAVIERDIKRLRPGQTGDLLDQLVKKIVNLRVTEQQAKPLIRMIDERTANTRGFARKIYYNLINARAHRAGTETTEKGDTTPVTFQGVELDALFKDEDTADAQHLEIEPVFQHLKVAPRTDDGGRRAGFYIEPMHGVEPGTRCCYVQNGDPDVIEVIGCESEDRDNPSYAELLKEYLEAGRIMLDDLRKVEYFRPQFAEPIVPDDPDVPRGFHKQGTDFYIIHGTEPLHVCSLTYVTAEIVDESGKRWGYQIAFWNGQQWQSHNVAATLLETEGVTLFTQLTEAGLRLNQHPQARAAFRNLIKASPTSQRVVQYSRPGWHKDKFVSPAGVAITDTGCDSVLVAPEAATRDQRTGGTFEAWQGEVSGQIWKGDTPQFAMGQLAGAVGVITSLLNADHPVIFFTGDPASGKTSSQEIATGLTANPAPNEGTLVKLQDDVDAIVPKGVGTCASVDDPTKGGSERRVEALLYRASGVTPFTVSSVATLEALVEKAGSSMDDGIRRRCLIVDTRKVAPIDPFRADMIKEAARSNFGHAMPRFVAEVMRQGLHTDTNRLRQMVLAALKALPGDLKVPETYAAAKHVAVLYVVAKIMRDAGLIPTEADTDGLLNWVWQEWLDRAASPLDRSVAALDAALRDPEVTKPLGEDPTAWAWTDGTFAYVRADAFDDLPGVQVGGLTLRRHLQAIGRLSVPGTGKNHTWPRLPGGHGDVRNYRVRMPPDAAGSTAVYGVYGMYDRFFPRRSRGPRR